MSIDIVRQTFLNELMKDFPSPGEDWFPCLYRVDDEGLIYIDDPYIVIRLHTSTGHWTSVLSIKTFGYGSYEWKAKLTNPQTNSDIFLGILENHHGWPNEGGIFIKNESGTYKFITDDGVGTESTNLTGQDWTSETTFKIVWDATKVELWVDASLEATHTTRVPSPPMQLFFEVGNTGVPAAEPYAFFRISSFKAV